MREQALLEESLIAEGTYANRILSWKSITRETWACEAPSWAITATISRTSSRTSSTLHLCDEAMRFHFAGKNLVQIP